MGLFALQMGKFTDWKKGKFSISQEQQKQRGKRHRKSKNLMLLKKHKKVIDERRLSWYLLTVKINDR